MGNAEPRHRVRTLSDPEPEYALVLGLDGSGKSTALNNLGHSKVESTNPRPGFHVDTLQWSGLELAAWDVRTVDPPFWGTGFGFYENCVAMVFVIDSTIRPEENDCYTPTSLLQDSLQLVEHPVPLLVFANKQDLKTAMRPGQIATLLELDKYSNPWRVQGSCSLSTEGWREGFEWICELKKFS